MVMAIGIAASAAGGLRANFGTMVKPLHAGYAARNGVLAALLAREGLIASEVALEHRYGYCNVFNHGIGYDPAPLSAWGEPLEILSEFGLALKPFPSCGATHTGIEAALLLRKEIGGAPIRSVRAGVSEMAFEPLIHVMPNSGLEGKFSLHYCIAAAVASWVAGRDVAECVALLGAASIPCGPIAPIDRHPREANLEHRSMILRLSDPRRGGECYAPASPLRMSVTPGQPPRPASPPGGDREAVRAIAARHMNCRAAGNFAQVLALPLAGIAPVFRTLP